MSHLLKKDRSRPTDKATILCRVALPSPGLLKKWSRFSKTTDAVDLRMAGDPKSVVQDEAASLQEACQVPKMADSRLG